MAEDTNPNNQLDYLRAEIAGEKNNIALIFSNDLFTSVSGLLKYKIGGYHKRFQM